MTVTVANLGERALRRLGVTIVAAADRPALTVIIAPTALATGALVELGVIAADETPSAADAALAASKVASVHDVLVAQAVVPWGLNAVPQAVSEEYIKLTANIMASSFGKPGDPAIHAALEARVRKVAVVLGALDIAVGAVMTVHHQLTARGLARWTIFDLPVAAEDIYVSLAAVALAPELPGFGPPPPATDAPMALRALAQIISLPTSGEQITGVFF